MPLATWKVHIEGCTSPLAELETKSRVDREDYGVPGLKQPVQCPMLLPSWVSRQFNNFVMVETDIHWDSLVYKSGG